MSLKDNWIALYNADGAALLDDLTGNGHTLATPGTSPTRTTTNALINNSYNFVAASSQYFGHDNGKTAFLFVDGRQNVTVTGSSGVLSLVISGTTYTTAFTTDLNTTVAKFVTDNAAAILSAAGLTVTSASNVLTFAKRATTSASFPVITAVAGGLTETVGVYYKQDLPQSWVFWMRPTLLVSGSQLIMGMRNVSATSPAYCYNISLGANVCRIRLYSVGNSSATYIGGTISTTGLSVNTWSSVAISYTGSMTTGGFEVYVNGAPVTFTAESAGIYAGLSMSTPTWVMGGDRQDATAVNLYNGLLDVVGIRDSITTATEAWLLWNNGTGRNNPLNYKRSTSIANYNY